VSIDEMTGVQALERTAPDLPMRPGDLVRREFEYIRHGTLAHSGFFGQPKTRSTPFCRGWGAARGVPSEQGHTTGVVRVASDRFGPSCR